MIPATITISLPAAKWWRKLLWLFRRRTYRIRLPERWEEVPPKKLKPILKALLQRGQLSDRAVGLLILRELLPLSRWLFYKLPPMEVVEKLQPCVKWFLDTPIAVPVCTTISCHGKHWLLPEPAARNMALQQYLSIEQEWRRMVDGDVDIPTLLACLLRPVGESTTAALQADGLLPSAPRPQLRAWANDLARLPEVWVYYLIEYWQQQRLQLQKDYPTFFTASADDDGSAPEIDWDLIPGRIAEAGVFGPVHQVLRTPVRTYLAWANANKQEAGEQQQKSLQDMIRQNHQKYLA